MATDGTDCLGMTGKMLPKNSQARAERPKTRIESEHRSRSCRAEQSEHSQDAGEERQVNGDKGAARLFGARRVRNLSATPAVFRIGYQASHGKSRRQ